MFHTHIKICGIKDAETAAAAVRCGADYIGIVFYPYSKRYVTLEQAVDIAEAVHEQGGQVVPVFVDHQRDFILESAARIHADVLQLHGAGSVSSYSELSARYPCIVAAHLAHDVRIAYHNDFLIYDSAEAGSGKVFNWDVIQVNQKSPNFIAGGLHAGNVRAAIAHFKPYAIDISSGVEGDPGQKDIGKIREICELVGEEVML